MSKKAAQSAMLNFLKRKSSPKLESVANKKQILEPDETGDHNAISSTNGVPLDKSQSSALLENQVVMENLSRSHHDAPVQPILKEYPQT